MMGSSGEWEPDAANWVRWARTPGHDAYWYYRNAFFGAMAPPPGRRTLEVGCGEGRVARDLQARGHEVMAIDTSHTLLLHATVEDPDGLYIGAGGAALPFPNRSFDLAVAYNSLQVVDDMAGTVQEIARTLEPGGLLCACIAHPVTDLGRFATDEAKATFALRPDYFATRRVEDTVEFDGLSVTLRGWTYTLEDYFVALEQAGLQVISVREPRPDSSAKRFQQWQEVPLFLFFRAVKA